MVELVAKRGASLKYQTIHLSYTLQNYTPLLHSGGLLSVIAICGIFDTE
jgi:hypothetical protein